MEWVDLGEISVPDRGAGSGMALIGPNRSLAPCRRLL